ncbi:TetR/AcrR family transcriptional regulator [Nesterenkonia natronophila]|uniref:TetR/AcrR family transcriptional regulator n=1 Tax=Nesterenkonia natronophila TaxID=2174932 RepID=A0A3A4F6E4_9MICC|nr:TetR/AcrR family transcriptional regulator [Nesterenkonia natronophila]RJN32050.1 TetR/AcrR family transcriptional regulator [Nesterenkonia natronophila]
MASDSSGVQQKTRRQTEKEQRYRDLLEAAGRLFGTHGYASVALDDIGSAVGVSGQAIYRHFKGKQDLLGRLLLDSSYTLLEGGRRIRDTCPDVHEQVEKLIEFHVHFALESPEIIRVQEQEMSQLVDADRAAVRQMQREYIDIWGAVLQGLHADIGRIELRTRIHGVFGLINSTAHSMKHSYRRPPTREEVAESAPTLAAMAQAAINCRISGDCGEKPLSPGARCTE